MVKDFREASVVNGDLCLTIAMEELAELTKEISKMKRGKLNKKHMAEEIADVLIVLEWVKRQADLKNTEIVYWLDLKKKRVVENINSNNFF